MFTFLL